MNAKSRLKYSRGDRGPSLKGFVSWLVGPPCRMPRERYNPSWKTEVPGCLLFALMIYGLLKLF